MEKRSLTITSSGTSITAVEADGGLFIPGFTLVQFVLFLTEYVGSFLATAEQVMDEEVDTPLSTEPPVPEARRQTFRELRAARRERTAAAEVTKKDYRRKPRANFDLKLKDIERIQSAVTGESGLSLTQLQHRVLSLRYPVNGEPMTYKGIAKTLNIRPETVREEIRHAFGKLGIRAKSKWDRGNRANGRLSPQAAQEVLAQTTT